MIERLSRVRKMATFLMVTPLMDGLAAPTPAAANPLSIPPPNRNGEQAMANMNNRDGLPPDDQRRDVVVKKNGWLPWALLALGVLALLFGLRRCNHDDAAARVAPATAPATTTTTTTTATTALAGTSGVGGYLGGTEALPRTFVFEKLNFDTAKSDVRAGDRSELDALAAAMKQYPNARIRIVGYTDARGAAATNAALGKERADSVKAALVADGIDAVRLDTASGGETNPVDTNATAAGQAENRRTELVVLQR
jgi:outer membrane protein OmpA-like peptidoglycan-associated protein